MYKRRERERECMRGGNDEVRILMFSAEGSLRGRTRRKKNLL